MAVIRYADFDLEITPEGDGFRIHVLSAPSGTDTSAAFPALDAPAMTQALGYVDHPRDAVRVDDLRAAADTSVDELKAFGKGLFEALLTGEVGEAFAASRRQTAEQAMGLRIRLRVAGDLTTIPWEFLFHGALDRFLGLSVDTPIVRYLDVPEPIGIVNVTPPLRILIMGSEPEDYPKLDVAGEIERLEASLAPAEAEGLVKLERLGGATMEELHDRLLHGDCHVFHYIGHGGFDDQHQDGLLVLEGPGKAGVLVPGDDLGIVLNGHHTLRLAVLNTCEGARGSVKDPFAGTAQGLIQQGIPSVIAMQFPISDVAAKEFSRRLYSTIALGYPIDAALCEARKSVYLAGHRLEWATPVLYMRTPDGRIFSVEGAAPVEARIAEIDPLAPLDAARDEVAVTAIVADGAAISLEGPHGGLLSVADRHPDPRLRRPPLDLRPKDFPDLLGRDEQVRIITTTFLANAGTASAPVEIFGPSGSGKTALVRNVAHHPSAQFPDGVVYTASRQPPSDLLRFLFQTFYETPVPSWPNEAELRDAMQDVQALVILDDVGLDRRQLGALENVAPRCLFVMTSEAQLLMEGGPAFALSGLHEAAAIELFERRLGRSVTPDERPVAQALVEAVGGLPLLLAQAAARVRIDGRTIDQVLEEARERPSKKAPVVALPSLTEAETRVAAVLAAVAGPVGSDLLSAATGLPDAAAVATELEDRGLVRSQGPRYALAQAPTPELAAALEATPWGDRALGAMADWAEGFVLSPGPILEESDALLGMLRWGEAHGRSESVVRLGRTIERGFALGARWEQWRDVLERTLGAARQLNDSPQIAWALHQLGTRLVALDEVEAGHGMLREALEIRESIHDPDGAEVTKANLGFRAVGGHGNGPNGGKHLVRWALLGLAAVIIGVATFVLWPDRATATGAALEVDPASIDFGDQVLGVEGPTVTVTIISTGDQVLEIGQASFELRRGYKKESDNCSGHRLPPEGSCSIGLSFKPQLEGDHTTALIIPHNAEGTPLRIELSGEDVPPPSGSPSPDQVARINIDTPDGTVFTSGEDSRRVVIQSTGTIDLVFGWEFDPADAASQFFESSSTCSEDVTTTLPPGTECIITFGFEADYAFPTRANLEFSGNVDTSTISLSGEPVLGSALGLPFHETDSEPPYEATLTISNQGTDWFDVFSIVPTEGYSLVEEGCSGTTLLPTGSCSVTVGTSNCLGTVTLEFSTTISESAIPVVIPEYDVCVD